MSKDENSNLNSINLQKTEFSWILNNQKLTHKYLASSVRREVPQVGVLENNNSISNCSNDDAMNLPIEEFKDVIDSIGIQDVAFEAANDDNKLGETNVHDDESKS